MHRSLIPLAIDNFAELISYKNDEGEGYLFVDKSLLIKEFYSKGAKVTLITRPRRFGKTLNLSMLQHFFSPEVDGVKTKGLFDQLAIARHPEVMALQGQHPSIFLTLKSVRGNTYAEMSEMVKSCVKKLYDQHEYLLSSPQVQESKKKIFRKVQSKEGNHAEDGGALQLLSDMLYQHTGKQAYIFLDEYDTPMHEAYVHGYYEACKDFMASFLGEAFKGNAALAKGLLTGILKVSQANLFSQFNNPTIDTLINPIGGYAPYFGFTEVETDRLLDAAGLPKKAHELKEMYNGYQIGRFTLYNPFSIVSFIGAALALKQQGAGIEQALQYYWVNTSSNQLIRELVAANFSGLESDLTALVQGGIVRSSIDTELLFNAQMGRATISFWSLLLLAGYVKVVGQEESASGRLIYHLRVPNEEVRQGLRDILMDMLAGSTSSSSLWAALDDLAEGKVDEFASFLADYLEAAPSFLDTGTSDATKEGKEKEPFFHGLVLGITAGLLKTHVVTSNRESGKGRWDIAMTPRNKKGKGVILELKVAKQKKDLRKEAEGALAQIFEKDYFQPMRAEGVQEVIAVGAAFKGKDVEVVWRKAG